MIRVEYLLHVQCYKVANLQHLIVAEYYTSSFPANFIALVLAVVIVLLWFNAALNIYLSSAALHAICFRYNGMINIGTTVLNS